MRASSPSSSSRPTRMRACRLPAAYCRAVSMMAWSDRASDAERRNDTSAVAARAARRASAAERHRSSACAPTVGERARQPRDRDDPAVLPDGHGRVEQVLADRGAVPLRLAGASGERLLDLRAVRVVLQPRELRPRDRRVGEDAAVGGDDRDARLDVARGRVHDGVERVLARAAGELVLDDTGHEPRLGRERVRRLVARAALQRGPREHQERPERHGRSDHRRHHHAPAQRKLSDQDSPSRARRYPIDLTVMRRSARPGSFSRRRRTCTSTVRVPSA